MAGWPRWNIANDNDEDNDDDDDGTRRVHRPRITRAPGILAEAGRPQETFARSSLKADATSGERAWLLIKRPRSPVLGAGYAGIYIGYHRPVGSCESEKVKRLRSGERWLAGWRAFPVKSNTGRPRAGWDNSWTSFR